jgi:hypothetical protein
MRPSRAFVLLVIVAFHPACGTADPPPSRDASGGPDGMQMPVDAPKDTPVAPPGDAPREAPVSSDGPTSGDGPGDVPPAAFGTVAGRITLAGTDDPIIGARVSAGGVHTLTDDHGRFALAMVPASDRVVVSTTKDGYGESLEPVSIPRDGRAYLAASLLPATVVMQMDATMGGLVDDGAGSVARFTAGSLVRANGETASGPVTVSVAALDPTDPVAMMAFPGDFSARRMDGSQILIETVVPMSVSVRQGNEELNIRSGMNAEITLPIPAQLADEAPATIPLWSLDESTGAWKEEGTATRQADPASASGFVYKATVTHLSWWNADKPITVTCIRGCAQLNGGPAPGVVVHAVGQDYSGETLAHTGADGCFALDLKRSSQALIWAESAEALSDGTSITTPDAIMRAGTNLAQCRDIGTVTLEPRAMMNAGCPMGLTRCGEECINLNSDRQHCGACNQFCDLACSDGQCGCPANQTQCGRECINTRIDRENCGACGNDCPSGQTCSAAACVDIVCPTGQSVCDDQCVNVNTDAYNCGACARRCNVGGGQICSAGSCACPTGLSRCSAPSDGEGPGGVAGSRIANFDVCVDFTADRNNCGACGTACATGQTCTAGACVAIACGSGLTLCGNECVNLASNQNHCGSCNRSCYSEGGQQVCTAGACACPTGQTKCVYPGPSPSPADVEPGYSVCVDTGTNRYNCGTCGNVCATGQTCTTGACVAITCPTGQTLCGDTCVDLQTDSANCGACNQYCNGESRMTCRQGACSCPTGQTGCTIGENFVICRDTQNDRYNCGGCGTECPSGQRCDSGTCMPITCGSGQTLCGEACTNLQTDPANCGGCNKYCYGEAGQTCSQGTCVCTNGMTRCAYGEGYSVCRNTQTDRYNCGACGTICPTGQTCSAGSCVPLTCETGLTVCGDQCSDLQTDPGHCGACNQRCDDEALEVCAQGVCGCAAGQTKCSYDGFSLCRNTQADRYNCGSCGNECPDNQICSAGVCAAITCQGGLSACDNSCVDLQTDPSHCGSCDTYCPSRACTGGQCVGGEVAAP